MDTIEAILTRRSIRRFTSRKITDELIDELLKAAMYAPTARNTQSWQFILIDDRETLDKIPNVHPYAEMMREAQLAVLICGDLTLEKSAEYNAINCAAATQNLLLAAHANGLGAVWLGVYPRKKRMEGLINLFNIPEHIIPISLVSIGYPDEIKTSEDRFNRLKIHINKW